MISSAILSVLLAQTAASSDQVIGALNTLQQAVTEARAGSRQITAPGSGKRACIRPATSIPAGAVTVRFGVGVLESSFQEFLGLPIPSHIPTTEFDPMSGTTVTLTSQQRWRRTADQYAVFEVQAVPTTAAAYDRAVWTDVFDVIEEEMFVVGSPSWAPCEVAMFRVDDANFGDFARCACWDGARVCTYQRVNLEGGTTAVACPKGMTMRPGSFSGPGAVAKPCYVRFDTPGIDRSWPTTCPK